MSRVRSPNYPYIDFPEAIQKTREIFEKEKMNPASREVLAKAMGYSGITGSSSKVIAALSSYGLIEGRGEDYKISKNGIDILIAPKGSTERATAIQTCAFSPPLFAQLKDRFSSKPQDLPSDESFQHYLVQNNFSLDGAKAVTDSFRATINYIYNELGSSVSDNDNISEEELETDSEEERVNEKKTNVSFQNYNCDDSSELLSFRISKDCTVKVIFDGEITPQAIDKLVSHLNLAKDVYEDNSDDPLS